MKKFRTIAAIFLALCLVFLCAGCMPDLSSYDNADIRQHTETILDALIADDLPTAYSLLSYIWSESEFVELFPQMQQLISNADPYDLKLLYIQSNFSMINAEQTKTIHSTYDMEFDQGRVIVDITVDEQYNIVAFYLTPYEYTDYYFTGTLSHMQDASALQWIFLLLNVIALGVSIFAIVDCCRQKIRRKALWIILLILGFVTVGFTLSASMIRANFNLGWITAYSALIRYGSGALMVRLMLPAGAIAYLAARKSLLQKAALQSAPPEDLTEVAPENEPADMQDSSV